MVTKVEKSVGMSHGEIKAYIQIGPKTHSLKMAVHASNYLSLYRYDKRSTTISLRESKTAS